MEGVKGAIPGYSKIAANGKIFYIAEDGIYSLGADGSNTPVGSQRINREFRENSDQARLDRILGFSDPYSTRIYWSYYKTAASTSYDGLLGYDWLLDRLFFVDAEAQFWAALSVPGKTLEELNTDYPNLDAMTVSLDSRQFLGGRPTLGAVNSSGKLALLSGPNMAATLRISAVHLVPGWRALLQEVEPIGEWGEASLSLRVGKREHGGQTATWDGPFSPNPETGVIYPRASARLHELELTIEGEGWTFAQALQTTEKPDGRR
jgi:hypothetical protein